MVRGEGGVLELERVRVLPIRVGPPASCTLCCQVEGEGQLLPPIVLGGGGVVPYHLPVPGRASSL